MDAIVVRSLALAAAVVSLSCHASSNSVISAAVMTPLALGASATNRATGGCYAVCQQGEACNNATGLCEALPCRGKCRADESCEEGFLGIKCIPGPALSVTTASSKSSSDKEKPKVPDAAKP